MVKLNLEAEGTEQQAVLSYLQENVSETLADKINNGIYVEKDSKRLLNKKDLNGFMRFACNEAKKLAEKNAQSACVMDSVVYGWAVHYFEEDSIDGTLFNEDGTEYKKVVPTQPKTTVTAKPVITKPKKNEGQVSIFDMNFDENEQNDVDDEEQDDGVDDTDEVETPPSGTGQAAAKPTLQADSAITQKAEQTTVGTLSPKSTEQRTEKPTLQETQSAATPQVNSAELFSCRPLQQKISNDSAEIFYYKYTLIQKQYPEHVVFYRLGDFYEAFAESAEKASNVLNITLTGKNCGSYGRLPMCGIPYHAVDKYIDKLRNKYDVALMHSDKELKLLPKKEFADIVQENAEKLDAMTDDDELGLVIDEDTDKEIDGLPLTEYSKYFDVEQHTDKITGEIKAPKIDKNLFEILYKLFDGQIVMG